MSKDSDPNRRTLEDMLAEMLADALEGIYQSLGKRIEEAVSRAATSQLIYRDVWNEVVRYRINELVTHAGGLWICYRDDPKRPGDKDSGWRLIVKSCRKGDCPSLSINIDGVLTATYPDGTMSDIGSVKELIRNLLIEHGLGGNHAT